MWVEGTGPALVLVHGSIADHTTFEPFVAVLHEHLTTFSMNRRDFGASGDTADYDIERDFEDIAAVMTAVAALTGGPVSVWGHSYGANYAMGGAALTTNARAPSCCTSRASACPYRPDPSTASTPRWPRATTNAAISAVLVDILEMMARRSTCSAPAHCGRCVCRRPKPSTAGAPC